VRAHVCAYRVVIAGFREQFREPETIAKVDVEGSNPFSRSARS
jgi:hypothetical protein